MGASVCARTISFQGPVHACPITKALFKARLISSLTRTALCSRYRLSCGLSLSLSPLSVSTHTNILSLHTYTLYSLSGLCTGNEGNVLTGATRLFARRTVAHVLSEFDPRLIRRSGTTPRAIIERLHAAGFICFDVRNPTNAPWALDRTHPLGADEFIDDLDKHEAAALRRRNPPKWAVHFGAFDDLACANVAKVWRPANPLESKSQP